MSEQIVSDRHGRHHAEAMKKPRPVWSLLAEKGHYPIRLVSHALPEELRLRHWTERIDALVSAKYAELRRFAIPVRFVAGQLPVTEFSVPEVTR